MDTFTTFARLGGATALPTDRSIDGIDQTSWLLAPGDDRQESNRESVYCWGGQEFYATRWREFKRFEQIAAIGMDVGPSTHGGTVNAWRAQTTEPEIGWVFNIWSDPKERMPIFRTWLAAPMVELPSRNKLSFVLYPQAPRGVFLNGYILGGPAGGTLPARFADALRTQMRDTPADAPD